MAAYEEAHHAANGIIYEYFFFKCDESEFEKKEINFVQLYYGAKRRWIYETNW